MYGMVNLGLAMMVKQEHGDDTWTRVTAAAGYPGLTFVSNEPYDDSISYALVGAASRVLGEEPAALLEQFGRYWVVSFADSQYRTLMEAAGSDVRTFLRSLNNLHVRVGLIFPGFRPPQFEVRDETPEAGSDALRIAYYSEREGLAPFVVGLLRGVADRFGVQAEVAQVAAKGEDSDHDEFLLTW
ncbi:MAG: heme NO-binding domain-containing protein [Candidatus Nanopelagicales bacterium]